MKLANPLHYPLAVLAGGIVLVTAVRLIQLPPLIMLPVSAAIATAGATILKTKEPEPLNIDNLALIRELESIQQQSRKIAAKAENLKQESQKLLTSSTQLELLSRVHYACDRVRELPGKINELAHRLHGSDSLLSVNELQEQLKQVEARMSQTRGVAREQLNQLAVSLHRNIELAQQGEDARQAQVISLSNLITDSAGVLQDLQNQLRTADLNDSEKIQELSSLSNELRSFQDNLDLIVK